MWRHRSGTSRGQGPGGGRMDGAVAAHWGFASQADAACLQLVCPRAPLLSLPPVAHPEYRGVLDQISRASDATRQTKTGLYDWYAAAKMVFVRDLLDAGAQLRR